MTKSSTILTLSALAHVLVDSFTVALAVIVAEIFGRSGRYFSVGVILAFFTLATAISEPLWGRLSDRTGKRGTIVSLGLVFSCVFFFSFSMIDPGGRFAVALFSLASFMTGIAAGTYHSVATAMLNEQAEVSNRGFFQGMNNAGGSLGRTAAPLVIAFIIGRFQMAAVFLPYLVFGGAIGIFSLMLFPRSAEPAAGDGGKAPLPGHLRRFTLSLMLFSFLRTAFFLTAMNFLPSYLMGFKGFGAVPTGYMMTFILATGVVAQPIGGKLSDVRDRARLMALLLASSGVCFGVAVFLPTALSVVLLALSFFGLLMTFPILFALIGDFVPRDRMGLMTGLVSGAGGIAATVFQLATGYLSELFPPPMVLLGLSGLPLLSAAVAFRLDTSQAKSLSVNRA